MGKTVKHYVYKEGDAEAKSLAEKFLKIDAKKSNSKLELTDAEWQALIQNRLITMANRSED